MGTYFLKIGLVSSQLFSSNNSGSFLGLLSEFVNFVQLLLFVVRHEVVISLSIVGNLIESGFRLTGGEIDLNESGLQLVSWLDVFWLLSLEESIAGSVWEVVSSVSFAESTVHC